MGAARVARRSAADDQHRDVRRESAGNGSCGKQCDPDQEYFADAITDDLTTDLSQIRGSFVIARTTAFTYKGKAVKVQQVAQELGVPFILEGSVRKAGARVRVTAQLISSESGAHVWADRYDRDLTDIFAIQDEITHAIVDQLKVKLLPQEKKSIKQTPTDNVEAYTFYLRGRQFIERRSKVYYQLARQMFAEALGKHGLKSRMEDAYKAELAARKARVAQRTTQQQQQ